MTAQPTGKQNTFAAFNLPDLVLVEVSDTNLPVSYANAFLKPVKVTHDQTLMQRSVSQLGEYLEKVAKAYNLNAKRACLNLESGEFPASETVASLDELKAWVKALLPGEA